MKRIVALLLLCTSTLLFGYGQIKPLGEAVTDSFPKISFNVNSRDPDSKPASFFKLKEAEKEMAFEVKPSHPPDSGVTRNILILWEYLPNDARAAQAKYVREMLMRALPEMLQDGDQVNIATFSWTDKKTGEKTLHFLTDGFTSDTVALRDSVANAKSPGKAVMADHGSELYPALTEGIETLAPLQKGARVLVIISAEFPNIFNPGGEISMTTAKAREADVSVYNLRYRVMNPKYKLDDLAKGSFGLSQELDPGSVEKGTAALLSFVDQSAQRSLGYNYGFSYNTDYGKDGKSHQVLLFAGTENFAVAFHLPSPSILDWVRGNALLAGIIGVLVIGLLLGGGLLIRARGKKSQVEKEEQQRKLREMEEQGKSSEERLQQQQQQLNRIKQDESQKRIQEENERKRKAAEEEAKRLLEEMFANGKSPRVTIMVGDQPTTIPLPGPICIFGRDAGSSVQIDHPTISRSHFQIVFVDGRYSMLDLNSTNGTALNGNRISHAEIRHGDVIKAGDVAINFYI